MNIQLISIETPNKRSSDEKIKALNYAANFVDYFEPLSCAMYYIIVYTLINVCSHIFVSVCTHSTKQYRNNGNDFAKMKKNRISFFFPLVCLSFSKRDHVSLLCRKRRLLLSHWSLCIH